MKNKNAELGASKKPGGGIAANILKNKKTGFMVVVLCVLACKASLIIALLGFGSLSAASVFFASSTLSSASIVAGVASLLALVGYLVYRIYFKAVA